jgi:hypothetical protein
MEQQTVAGGIILVCSPNCLEDTDDFVRRCFLVPWSDKHCSNSVTFHRRCCHALICFTCPCAGLHPHPGVAHFPYYHLCIYICVLCLFVVSSSCSFKLTSVFLNAYADLRPRVVCIAVLSVILSLLVPSRELAHSLE